MERVVAGMWKGCKSNQNNLHGKYKHFQMAEKKSWPTENNKRKEKKQECDIKRKGRGEES